MLCVVKNSSNLWAHELMTGICFNPYLYVTAMAPTYTQKETEAKGFQGISQASLFFNSTLKYF